MAGGSAILVGNILTRLMFSNKLGEFRADFYDDWGQHQIATTFSKASASISNW